MPVPGNITTITVTGLNLTDAKGTSYYGNVFFTPSAVVSDSSSTWVMGTTQLQQSVAAGVMTPLILPCTNSPNMNPASFTYTIRLELAYATGAPVVWLETKASVAIPTSLGSTVDLAALLP